MSIPFRTPFVNVNPIVVGNVLQNPTHSPDYSGSDFSVVSISPTSFYPGVYQTWPSTGINYLAIASLSTDYTDSPYIFDFQSINYPSQIIDGQGQISFTKTFPEIPTVVCTIYGEDGGHDLGVFNITKDSFQIYSTVGWPKGGINYIAVSHNPGWTGDLKSLPFQIQFGTITNPSPTEWIGGFIFPNVFQSTPVVVGTASFLNTPTTSNCNVTFDSISCNMVHINVSGGYPNNGIQYIAICEYVQPTSSLPPLNIDGNVVQLTGLNTTTSSSVNNPISIITSPIGLNTFSTLTTSITPEGYITPYIDINNVVNQSFTMTVGANNVQNVGGVSFISFAHNLASIISKFDLPYLIDFGQFENIDIADYLTGNTNSININIPFNFTFPSQPTVILSSNDFASSQTTGIPSLDEYLTYQTVSYISSITQNYFTTTFSSNLYQAPPSSSFPPLPSSTNYWIAISKNPNSSSSLQNPIDFGSYMIDPNNMVAGLPYSLQTVNGKENSKIYGMIEFTTQFSKQPVVISGNQLVQIDTITKDYFHINSNFPFQQSIFSHLESSSYYVSWIAIEFPTTIDNPVFTCPSTTYTDGCPSSIQISPSIIQPQCNTYTIDYLSITKKDIFPEISVYSPASSNPPSAALNLPDVVFCNIDVSKANTYATSSNGICYISSHNLGSSGGTINIDVNTSYGWFSRCSSFGSVFIRITTSYASDNQLIFNFTNVGLNENFQYYVQWGYAQDQIYGPFTTTYTGIFGTATCSAFNIKCKIDQLLEKACVSTFTTLGVPNLSKANDYLCEEVASALGFECDVAAGGPEDFVGDAICAEAAFDFGFVCEKLLDKGEEMAIDELCSDIFG
jgi:hypothetical protein